MEDDSVLSENAAYWVRGLTPDELVALDSALETVNWVNDMFNAGVMSEARAGAVKGWFHRKPRVETEASMRNPVGVMTDPSPVADLMSVLTQPTDVRDMGHTHSDRTDEGVRFWKRVGVQGNRGHWYVGWIAWEPGDNDPLTASLP